MKYRIMAFHISDCDANGPRLLIKSRTCLNNKPQRTHNEGTCTRGEVTPHIFKLITSKILSSDVHIQADLPTGNILFG
jgi:hypothetical protein